MALEGEWDESHPPLVRRAFDRASRTLLRALCGFKVVGLEHVPRSGPLIVACNHISNLDGLVLALGLSPLRQLRFLGKAELFRVPLLGWLLREFGNRPLDRRRSDVGAVRFAEDVLGRGWAFGLFPEGTRSKTGLPLRPKPGIGYLAAKTGAPVLPARVVNTDKFLRLYPQEVRFGPPILFSGQVKDRAAYQTFSETVMETIISL